MNHSPFNPEASAHSDDNDNTMEMYVLAKEDTHMGLIKTGQWDTKPLLNIQR